jgi:pimeloyl-ACP methyl ester carboxylesterase
MRRGYVNTSLGQVYYLRKGTGPPLTLLAASGRSSRMFTGLIPLVASRFDVCAFDTPGFGNSDPLPEGTTIDRLADCFVEALNALGIDKTHIYGLHTGNKIAAAIAARRPALVDRIVLAGQSHSIIPNQQRRNATILEIVSDCVQESRGDGATTPLTKWAGTFRRFTDIWWNGELVSSGAGQSHREFALNLVLDELQSTEGTARLYLANFAYDFERDLAKITAPTLILEITTPDEDRTIGQQGAHVQKLIRGASLRTIDEPAGHTLTLENRSRDLADIVLEFLNAGKVVAST